MLTRLVKGYVSALTRFRIVVALFWIGVFAISCAFGPKLSAASSNKFNSPPGTPSALADGLMTKWFPEGQFRRHRARDPEPGNAGNS